MAALRRQAAMEGKPQMDEPAKLQFLGATRTVTGSKYVLEHDGTRVMVDCGLYQGLKELRLRNWERFPIDPAGIDAVILTHAHIDHTGYLPRLVKQGFHRTVYGSPGTIELSHLLLPDSARLQEEDARLANRKGFSKHHPALPLYDEKDARAALRLTEPVKYGRSVELSKQLSFEFLSAGHILGSSFVKMQLKRGGEVREILFSGDIGPYNAPILTDPSPAESADYVLIESTYGDRSHDPSKAKPLLAEVINETARRGGRLLVPAFAVGRTQELIYLIRELEDEKQIPILPVYVDSPMAIQATQLYTSHHEDHDAEMNALEAKRRNPLATAKMNFVHSARDSNKLCGLKGAAIVISASGMATGGRILSHLKECLPDESTTVLFVGFQAQGTRGRRLLEGEKEIKIHGQMIPVRARIESISSLSAHGDYNDVLRWFSNFQRAPQQIFVVHGEPKAAASLKAKIAGRFGWNVTIPEYAQTVEIS